MRKGNVMYRRHFIAMAAILKDTNADWETCVGFAEYFASQNQNFKFGVFMEACGYKDVWVN